MAHRISPSVLHRLICTAAHYWVAIVCDVAGALMFLALGISGTSGLVVISGAAVLAGFLP